MDQPEPSAGTMLGPRAQRLLVRLARAAIERAVFEYAGVREDPARIREEAEARAEALRMAELDRPGGAFVTLYVAGALRGCLGEIESADPVADVVARCARRTPIHDTRFEIVSPEDLPRLTFKISVLSPLEPVRDVAAIRLGVDGLLVTCGDHRGLLLPEVSTEYGWDLPTYLAHLWRKAGLPPDCALSEVALERFTAQVIAGEDFEG